MSQKPKKPAAANKPAADKKPPTAKKPAAGKKSGTGKKSAQLSAHHREVTNLTPAPAPVAKARIEKSALGQAGPRNPLNAALEAVKRPAMDAAPGLRFVAPSAPLHDVAEASFGPPRPVAESVIGVDQRVQITDTSPYPFRAIASLLIIARDNSNWVGTGWFISPRTLVTAGHCVFIHAPEMPERHGWVRSISVMPGRNGSNMPFGPVTSTEFKSVDGWTLDGSGEFDYGAIILPTALGDQVGTFGFGAFPDSELVTIDANISGYPADKPQGTQWFDNRTVVSVGPRKVFYDIDTAGGQSGAPVWRIGPNSETTAIAIHAYGVGGGVQSNSGTRITQEVFDNLMSWKA